MFDIKKFPIIIISGSRTGSTAVAFELKNKYNLEVFNESFSNIGGATYEQKQCEQKKLLLLIKDNQNNFVLKVHQHDLYLYPNEIHKIINDNQCYLIRIRRKDIASQCVSLYIERHRNSWVYFKHYTNEKIDALKNTSIVIEEVGLIKCINDIKARNDKLNHVDYTIDQDVWYEDLVITDDTFIRTPKPNNYDTIKEKVETFLKHGVYK